MWLPTAATPAPHAACQVPWHEHHGRVVSRRALLPLLTVPFLAPADSSASGTAAAAAEGRGQEGLATRPQKTELLRQQYDQYANTYDDLDGGFVADVLGFPDLRAQLLSQASGDVLEVGVGTGLNLRYYCPQQLTSLTAIDLSEGMLAQAQRRAAALGLPAGLLPLTFRQADAQALPFPPASFDTAVDTFSLCVFPDPLAALRSMAAVLRPGGRVLLLEHSRSSLAPLGWYQDLTAPAVAALGKGCVWNQDVGALAAAAGLRVVDSQEHLGGLVVSLQAERA